MRRKRKKLARERAAAFVFRAALLVAAAVAALWISLRVLAREAARETAAGPSPQQILAEAVALTERWEREMTAAAGAHSPATSADAEPGETAEGAETRRPGRRELDRLACLAERCVQEAAGAGADADALRAMREQAQRVRDGAAAMRAAVP